jgi:hypothetical protein
MLPTLAGLVAGLAYAAISVYWGAGGRWLLNTVGISLSRPGQAGHLAALLAVWGAAAVKAVAALLPLLAIGVWPRTAIGGASSPRPGERIARPRLEAWHGLSCCWT